MNTKQNELIEGQNDPIIGQNEILPPQNEFALLFKDPERTDLFAYFCIYPNPLDESGRSYIEHWAFVDENVQDLYGTSFFVRSMNGASMPTNKQEWTDELLASGEIFKGFMHRNSLLFQYKKEESNPERSNDIFRDLNVSGNKAVHINLEDKKDWIIIQESDQPSLRKNYRQLALLETLQYGVNQCFPGKISFSEPTTLSQRVNFKDFAFNNGLRDVVSAQLPSENIKYAIFSEVITLGVRPDIDTIPDDYLLLIPISQ